jgi:hypothetical protein
MITYHCPVCNKVSRKGALDLARHMLGRGDKVHRDWVNSKGFKFSEILAAQFSSFGGDAYKGLAAVIERETRVEEADPVAGAPKVTAKPAQHTPTHEREVEGQEA